MTREHTFGPYDLLDDEVDVLRNVAGGYDTAARWLAKRLHDVRHGAYIAPGPPIYVDPDLIERRP